VQEIARDIGIGRNQLYQLSWGNTSALARLLMWARRNGIDIWDILEEKPRGK
jgi:hypothetical protein